MKVIALLYHDVVPPGGWRSSGFNGPEANLYKLEEPDFERHLGIVQAHAKAAVTTVSSVRDGEVMITFDDGGRSSLHIADRLEARGWRGHFFVTTDWIGRPEFLNPAEIRDLHRRGHVIGAHSCSHPMRMATLRDDQLDREWRESVVRLQDILGDPVPTASIPGGLYGRNVAQAAARAGIRNLFTSEPVRSVWNVDGCRVFGRFGVQQGTSADWVAAVVAGALWPRVRRKVFWDAKKVLKMVGGEAWYDFRRAVIERRARTRPGGDAA